MPSKSAREKASDRTIELWEGAQILIEASRKHKARVLRTGFNEMGSDRVSGFCKSLINDF